jgi:hypothetical protein
MTEEVEALKKRCAELAEENVALMESQRNRDNSQIRAWAIDRAIETYKAGQLREHPHAGTVIGCAEKYVEWVNGVQKQEIVQ